MTYNWTGADLNKDISVKVFDNMGKLLLNRTLQEQPEGSLDISTYAPGMYFFQFENGDKTEKKIK
ncbi:MAG: T9SS type A sorting domain-containing protein [Saprospiraceae bacterium]|nr:T9SS type A sorting domain-containing protein [Saprospiraceae bacterium]